MPQKTWAVGEEVLAADFNLYVQNQVVPTFATVAARDSGWAAPPNGARCVTLDTDTEWSRVGGVWTIARGQQVAYAEVTASQGSIAAATVDVTGLTVTFTAAGAGRRYRIYAECTLQSTVAGDIGRIDICDGANVILQSGQYVLSAVNVKTTATVFKALAAGSVTFKLRAIRSAGTGTLTMNAGPTLPAFISAEAL